MKKWIEKIVVAMLCIAMLIITGCQTNSTANNDGTTNQPTTDGNATTNATLDYVSQHVKVAALKGPTAIGMVKLMKDNKEGQAANNYEFTIAAAADEFTSLLIKGDIQLAALPCNAAATLYNKSEGKIQLLGINTLGVLYILENGNTIQSIADLKGKTIYTTGKGTTPEYTLRHLLKSAGIDPDKDVVIEFKSEAAEVAQTMMAAGDSAVAMLPQPYVTTLQNNNADIRIALDVTKEWEDITKDGSTVVTGVIAVNTKYYENNKQTVDKFMEEYQSSVSYVNANVEAAANLVEEFDIFKAAVAKKAIPYCNITFITGEECKNKVSKYLAVLFNENAAAVGGKMPDENFYIR